MKFKAKMVTPVDIFRRKKIDARPMSTRERAMLPAAERVNSIFTANVEKAQFLQRLADMLDDFLSGKKQEIILPDGTSTTVGVMQGKADFIAKARAFMAAEGMAADAGDNRITNIGARSRLSLIFDTMTRCCYGQARWESGMTPEMLYSYPAWRFVRHPGARMPRPLHVLHEGAVRLKTDFQFWAVEMNSPAIGGFLLPWPLYGFNSWMDIESVSRAECIQDGLIGPNWTPGPVDMFRFGATMPERLMNRSASVQKIKDPDLAARLRESLKKRLGVDALDKDGRLAIPARELSQRMQQQAEQGNPVDVLPVQMMLNMDMVSKVGDKINIPASGISGKVRGAVSRASRSIDTVHTDGPLPQAHIRQTSSPQVLGSFNPWEKDAPIAISSAGKHPDLTACHEIGHYVDLWGLGKGQCHLTPGMIPSEIEAEKRSKYGSEHSPDMEELMSTIMESATLVAIRARSGLYYRYLERRRECFARAYAQFIAVESRDKILIKQLNLQRQERNLTQWTIKEFKPIRDAFRNLFRKKGWMK